VRVSDLSVGLLAYYIGTEYLYVLMVDQAGKITRFRLSSCERILPRIDLLMNVLEQPYAWTSSQRATVMRDFSRGWGRELLPPFDRLRPFDILLIVPHHTLHGVPLHLVNSDQEQLLASNYGIAYCSSCTLLARCIERNRARQVNASTWTFPLANDGAQAVGPPVTSCLSYGVDVLTGKDEAYRHLAQIFAQHFADIAIGTSRNQIKTALDPSHRSPNGQARWVHPDVICLVCHGYYNANTADLSGLLLAARRGVIDMRNVLVHGNTVLRVQDHPFADIPVQLDPVQPRSAPRGIFDPEPMTTGELRVHCETDAQLVALFGCSTGTGAVASADDYVSLAYQWLKTGVSSVIANLWEADFPIITDWVERFATNWVRLRQPKAIAAREATRALIVDRPELIDDAALWGSLVVLGDWL
jgi:CHAT domain-containing protein